MKLVSIVLPTYNGEEFLKQAIESIISQTYHNWELIIVNDCSSDSTPQIAEEYANKDKRIKVIHNITNKKIAGSLNIGFNSAVGDYWTWTSDDNYYLNNTIEQMVKHLDNNCEDVMIHSAFTRFNLIKNEETIIRTKTTAESILRGCTCGPCFLYRSSVAKHIGEYDESLNLAQDWDYWLRMLLYGNIEYIDEPLYVYRLHDNCLTIKNLNKVFVENDIVKKKYLKLYAERFPEIREVFKLDILLERYDDAKDGRILEELRDTFKDKQLYRAYKEKYIQYRSKHWLTAIKKLGLLYRVKAINLMRKYKTEDK